MFIYQAVVEDSEDVVSDYGGYTLCMKAFPTGISLGEFPTSHYHTLTVLDRELVCLHHLVYLYVCFIGFCAAGCTVSIQITGVR